MKNHAIPHFLIVVLALLLSSCGSDKKPEQITNDPRFGEYIKGHSEGTISKKDNITVQFSEIVPLPDDLKLDEFFSIEPSLDGSLVKTDAHSLVISPENGLKSGQSFVFTLKLDALLEVPEGLEEYLFRVNVIEQNFDIELTPVQAPDPANPDILEFEGLITTADFAENDAIEKMISLDEELQLTWRHLSSTSHRFAATGIKRAEKPRTIVVNGSGSPIGVKRSVDLRVEVPSIQVFSVISTKVEKAGDPYVSVYFSDPLDSKQNLAGLIQLEGQNNPGMVIEGNELKIYVSHNVSGSKKLEISEGLKNSKGKTLGQTVTSYVAFEPEKPQVKLIGSGTILPSTDGLVLPFEAVNLKAVQVEVVKIFEDNLPQYFQVNSYNGDEQIKRVGQKVIAQKISLEEKAKDLASWNRFTLDLSQLFTAEQGALYQVRIGFRPEDTNYPCEATLEASEASGESGGWSIYANDGFDSWGNLWSYSYPNGYRWSERDNPCHVSYYIPSRFVSTSLLATDIGLITKIGGDNSVSIFTTNLTTAEPIQANIKVLDYQLQELANANTDPKGKVTINPEKRPFLIIAESEGQKSYLRLSDNESLSMSNFDVSGTRVQGNVKGFIYGERGAWRPGDNIYLSFMLEDPEDRIPSDHPVVMELRDPRGNLKDKQVSTNGVAGLYAFQTKTSTEDVTGNWWATISVGNNTFSKTVKVETIKPNRLKIDLDLGEGRITPAERNLSADLHVDWLTGLKGSNLKTEMELRLVEANTTFDGYAQYEFDDLGKSFYQDPEQVFSGQVDSNGDATVNVPLPGNPKSPGALRAIFDTKVFEPGGGFSINSKSVTYLPYESFVGINLATAERGYRIERDKPQQMQVVSLSANGEPIDRKGLEFTLYKLNWRWWWDQSEDYTTNYLSSSYASKVKSEKINTSGGKGQVNFEIKSPNWGRYIAVVKDPVSGHSVSKIFYTSWYGNSGDNALGATSLQVSTDKPEYSVGEKINVTMRGSLSGRALVSVENGSTVLENFWIKTDKEWTTFTVDVTPEMAPNVYLHVTLLQPHGQTTNDLPIRLYGIAPVKVVDEATKLSPQLKMADELAPGGPVDITVSEADGKPMAYTVAVVDEGLLDITNYHTPQPWEHFYSREAIGVKTWDVYNDVIGAYGGRLERLLAIGGGLDAESENEKPQENRFKPVVQFMGPFYLEAGKSKKHSFTMPQYIGSVKTMVVAGLDEAYGSVDKATPVIKPLMVLGTLPRVVGPGEKVSLPVNVFRYKDNIRNAKISVEASGVVSLDGSNSQNISLDKESGTLYFDLSVADKLGAGKVTITGTSGGESAKHEINIASRSPNAPQTTVKVVPIEAGQAKDLNAKLFGMEGTNEVALEIASIPPINLEQRLKYLIRYPHGCIEQTVSSAFPQLFLADVTELTGEQVVKTESNVRNAIKKIERFQGESGGLSYWPGYDTPNSWGTSYAYHFLVEAQKKGYVVPNELIDRIRNFQRTKARNWTKSVDHSNSDLIQAYRLFTLAIGGYPELGAMNRLRNTSGKSVQSIHKLAAAYAAIGQVDAAKKLMEGNARASLKEHPYHYYYYNYGSYTRDLSMLLEAYVYLDNKTEAFKVLQEISEKLSSDRWMSTQTTAYSLLAISKYVNANNSDKGLKAAVSYGSTNTTWSSDRAIYRSDIPAKESSSLKVENQGEATLFATLTVTGTPRPGDEPVENSGLEVSVRYLDMNGRTINPDSLKLGQSFEILVNVKNRYDLGSVRDIALTHILPSGWEIQNDRLNDNETNEYSRFDFQDIRDDRVYTYFDLRQNEQKTFSIKATAAYPGKYYMPGLQAEAMYKASISAKTAGKWISVNE